MNPPIVLSCPACGAAPCRPSWSSADKNRGTTDRIFTIYRCGECGVGITFPVLHGEELAQSYPKVYYNLETYRRVDITKLQIYKYQLEKTALLRSVNAGGRLLDLGCGIGLFVHAASHAGYLAEGIEMSPDAVAFGKEHLDVNISQGVAESYTFPVRGYDIITMWHVLEHLDNPSPILQKIHPALKNGGILVVAVPNFASVQAGIFRSHWYHLDVPRHMVHYTPNGLTRLLAKKGFTVERIHNFSREHNWAGFTGSIFDLHGLRKESFFHKVGRKTYGYYLGHALAWIESAIGKGGTMTIIARKAERVGQ